MIRVKVNINKGTCQDFIRGVLDGYKDDYDDIPVVYPAMNILPCQLHELPCLRLVLILLEFIICVIESTCHSLLLHNPDSLLQKDFEAFNGIDVILESIKCEKVPPLW